jgi:endonuclease/exonuclease/phosphatase (EEP) superfamily protein YafD
MAVLAPLTLILRKWRLAALIGLAAMVVAGPLLGFCVPWRTALQGRPRGRVVRVMTCNVLGSSSDKVALGRLVLREQPDLVLLQESARDVEAQVFWQGRWHFAHAGEITLASRYPIMGPIPIRLEQVRSAAIINFPVQLPDATTVNVFGVHLSTPRSALEAAVHFSRWTPQALQESMAGLWFESDNARRWMRQFPGPAIVAGDFNQPVEVAVFRRYWSDLGDAFSEAGFGLGPTKFTRWFGARIDHILHDSEWRARRSWVGPDIGSDHRPVFAELEWVGR